MLVMITRFFSLCKELIAPPLCAYCKTFISVDALFCTACFERVSPLVSLQLSVGKDVLSVHALSAYKDPIKRLILAKKWRDIFASKQLGNLIWNHTSISSLQFDCVVPIPLHWTRFMMRGYNQAEEIAKVIACNSKKPLVHALQRTSMTAYQASLTAEERKKNVHKAFSVALKHLSHIKDKHILLVDDLMTTSATIQVAARAFQVYEPAKISVVVAARVV